MSSFYHATTAQKWAEIQSSGKILAGAYFAVREIADYYSSVIQDEGDTPVLLCVSESSFDVIYRDIDRNGLDEPVCYIAFGLTETEVHELWEDSEKTVSDCIEIIGSFMYKAEILLADINVVV